MGNRVQLHEVFKSLIDSTNVYFQPPETLKICYPCIIYSRISGETLFANNKTYTSQNKYTVAVIDQNPDSKILEKVATLPMCKFDRHYTKDNLNHYVYNLYY